MTPAEQSFVRDKMQRIGKHIAEQVPGYGFVVMIFPFQDPDGRCNYISNVNRNDAANVVKEWLERNELPSDRN
jgi:hypothetical protein